MALLRERRLVFQGNERILSIVTPRPRRWPSRSLAPNSPPRRRDPHPGEDP